MKNNVVIQNHEEQVYAIMAQKVEELWKHLESIDPTGKVVAIEEMNHLKNVFNHILQEKKDDTGAYTFDDIVESFKEFANEYNCAISNFK
jgi:hypothetical protein